MTIAWDSVPNHDAWGPDSYWSCAEWIQWHRELVKKYGKEQADLAWIVEYDRSTYGATEISCATRSNEFKQYVIAEGLAPRSAILSRVYRAESSIDTAVENVTEPIKNLGSGIGEGLSSVGTIIKWLPWIIAGVAAVAAILYLRAAKVSVA